MPPGAFSVYSVCFVVNPLRSALVGVWGKAKPRITRKTRKGLRVFDFLARENPERQGGHSGLSSHGDLNVGIGRRPVRKFRQRRL